MTPASRRTSRPKAPARRGESRAPESPSPRTPPFDHRKTGRVGKIVEIDGIELVDANFWRTDDQALRPAPSDSGVTPEFGLQPGWELSEDRTTLGCLVYFTTLFPGELDESQRPPYSLTARFRLTYTLPSNHDLREDEIENFVHWNAVGNVWPYWREYLADTINRANLPRFAVPVMKMPMGPPDAEEPDVPF